MLINHVWILPKFKPDSCISYNTRAYRISSKLDNICQCYCVETKEWQLTKWQSEHSMQITKVITCWLCSNLNITSDFLK